MLEENLKPILEQLRSRDNQFKNLYQRVIRDLKNAEQVQSKRRDQLHRRRTVRTEENYRIAQSQWYEAYQHYRHIHKRYFKEIHDHARQLLEQDFTNMASDVRDLSYICTLPYDDYRALVDPILGNWFLDKIKDNKPQTAYQTRLQEILVNGIKEKRFNGSEFIEDLEDERSGIRSFPDFDVVEYGLWGAIRVNPSESDLICNPLREAMEEIARFYHECSIPKKDGWTQDQIDKLTFFTDPVSGEKIKFKINLGDGLYEHAGGFYSLFR